jgi:hypothetical protein
MRNLECTNENKLANLSAIRKGRLNKAFTGSSMILPPCQKSRKAQEGRKLKKGGKEGTEGRRERREGGNGGTEGTEGRREQI